MYIPKRYREFDRDLLEAFIHANGFATLITFDGTRPIATHLLMELQHGDGDTLYLNGHMARANKQWQTFTPTQEVLTIFSGPHTYISPRWYNHVNVPTWNYMMVHVYGIPRVITDYAELHAMLKRLVDKYEAHSGAVPPYQMEALPTDFVEREIKAIAGFQIEVTNIEASFKLSQNRDAQDYANIITELHKREDDNSQGVAEAMEKQQARTNAP